MIYRLVLLSAPGRIRTCDKLLRRQLLCPAELQGLVCQRHNILIRCSAVELEARVGKIIIATLVVGPIL